MADDNGTPIPNQDLFIFTNGPDNLGALYHVAASDWQQPQFVADVDFFASVRDMLANGALLIGFPLDTGFPPVHRAYVARLTTIPIDITRTLARGQTETPRTKSPPEGRPLPMQPDDLFLLAPPEGSNTPPLYRLPVGMYTKTLALQHLSNEGTINIRDMLSHGTALAAMPPSSGTLCYVISLASLALDNPAYSHQWTAR